MKFAKGVMLGGIVTAGVMWMCLDSIEPNKKMIMKKGKKILKKMGI